LTSYAYNAKIKVDHQKGEDMIETVKIQRCDRCKKEMKKGTESEIHRAPDEAKAAAEMTVLGEVVEFVDLCDKCERRVKDLFDSFRLAQDKKD